jgi:predicted AlkP superfamily pyrophosphatase or phosphodiesterase
MYFHLTDDQGHAHGTESAEVDDAIAAIDSALAQFEAGLAARGMLDEVDIIVVSDHGMADTSKDRLIMLDDAVDLDRVTVSDWNPVVAIWPDSGMESVTYEQLEQLPHLTVYRRAELPDRLHYRNHPRIAPLIGIADEGWSITTRQYAAEHPDSFDGATHGYDPALQSMQGVFIAAGPSFRSGVRLDPIENIHLYELMCAILGLTPAPNDGSIDALASVLTPGVLTPAD